MSFLFFASRKDKGYLYKEMAQTTDIFVEPHYEDVISRLTTLLKQNSDEAIARDDIFKIGLSGD